MKSPSAHMTAKDLFKTLVPLIRCDVSDMRETVVIGLGRINPEAFRSVKVQFFLPRYCQYIETKLDVVFTATISLTLVFTATIS